MSEIFAGYKTSPCRGCKQPVIWAETKSGKRQPFDPKPTRGVVLRARRTGPPVATAVDIYIPHHATCPQVAMFRRPAWGWIVAERT